ncbi:hypothetical protein [Bordetella flabilis]|nr:hypothetical protein [Bordetella flabilis]
MDQHKLQQYGDAERPRVGQRGEHHEVMEMFANIIAGRATPKERERYLDAWLAVTPKVDTVLAGY